MNKISKSLKGLVCVIVEMSVENRRGGIALFRTERPRCGKPVAARADYRTACSTCSSKSVVTGAAFVI